LLRQLGARELIDVDQVHYLGIVILQERRLLSADDRKCQRFIDLARQIEARDAAVLMPSTRIFSRWPRPPA